MEHALRSTLDSSAGDAPRRLLRAGFLTAICDGLFSGVLGQFFYHSTAVRVFQGVASTLLGPDALNGGMRTALIGVAMHIGVAFGWSAVFLALYTLLRPLRAAVSTPAGVAGVAAVYGPCVWLVMSLLVIPALVHRPATVTFRWWVQFFGHFPFVGLPIVSSISSRRRRFQ